MNTRQITSNHYIEISGKKYHFAGLATYGKNYLFRCADLPSEIAYLSFGRKGMYNLWESGAVLVEPPARYSMDDLTNRPSSLPIEVQIANGALNLAFLMGVVTNVGKLVFYDGDLYKVPKRCTELSNDAMLADATMLAVPYHYRNKKMFTIVNEG